MFPKDELKALLIFLNRVTLKGEESDTHSYLKTKITKFINAPEIPEEIEPVLSPIQPEDLSKPEPEAEKA